jgi:hypothetical protein
MVACEEVARENTREGEGEGTKFVKLGKTTSCAAIAV